MMLYEDERKQGNSDTSGNALTFNHSLNNQINATVRPNYNTHSYSLQVYMSRVFCSVNSPTTSVENIL